jgi:F-type H+-transporting ATPase subunit b
MVEEVKHVAEAAEAVSPLAGLGIDWRLLAAQLVNFGIVILVMWRWVYRPLQKVMDARTAKIEQGLKDAERAAAQRTQAEAERERLVVAARQEAKGIVEEADRLGKEARDRQLADARREVEAVVARGKEQLKADQAAMVAAAKAELSALVVAAAEKVLAARLDVTQDAAMIKAALESADKAAGAAGRG